jgi:WD and tetratricopeptide repeat-containing protein 1
MEKPVDAEKSTSMSSRSQRPKDTISDQELQLRANAHDYELRFCGHCNTTTDIKEANFFGRLV